MPLSRRGQRQKYQNDTKRGTERKRRSRRPLPHDTSEPTRRAIARRKVDCKLGCYLVPEGTRGVDVLEVALEEGLCGLFELEFRPAGCALLEMVLQAPSRLRREFPVDLRGNSI